MDLNIGGIVSIARLDSASLDGTVEVVQSKNTLPSYYASAWYLSLFNLFRMIGKKYLVAAVALGFLIIAAAIVTPILVSTISTSSTAPKPIMSMNLKKKTCKNIAYMLSSSS